MADDKKGGNSQENASKKPIETKPQRPIRKGK